MTDAHAPSWLAAIRRYLLLIAGANLVWEVAQLPFYTIFSEWLNTSVRGSWTYSDLMPVVPVIGTGLAPLLQWCVVPTLAQWIAVGRAPWIDQESEHS